MADRTVVLDIIGRDRASKAFDSAGKASQKSAGRVEKASGAAKVALAGLAAAAVVGAKQAIDAASDMNETLSKTTVVLGPAADSVKEWSKTSATAFGQSRQQALDAAAGFAVFGKSAGLSGDDLAGFSTSMVELASDMASFSNTTPEQAIEAIGAAMRGEAEPIRQYGVMLDDATLRNEALKLGLIKTTKDALTPQQKVLAAQAAILAQTKDAQGDFARTSDGLANKQRIAAAQVEDLKVKLGQGLLPVMLTGVTVMSSMVTWVTNNQTTAKVLAGTLVALVAAVASVNLAVKAAGFAMKTAAAATKVWAGVQWVLNSALFASPITWIVLGLVALGAAVVIAYKKSETFRRIVQAAWAGIKAGWDKTWSALKTGFGWLKDKFGVVGAAMTITAEKIRQGFLIMALGVGRTIEKVLDVASHIPGVGDKFRAARDAVRTANQGMQKSLDASKKKVQQLKDEMAGIKSKTVTVTFKTDTSEWYDPRNHGVKTSGATSVGGMSAGMAGGVTVIVQTPIAVGSSRQFRDAVVGALSEAQRRGA